MSNNCTNIECNGCKQRMYLGDIRGDCNYGKTYPHELLNQNMAHISVIKKIDSFYTIPTPFWLRTSTIMVVLK